MRVVRRRQRKTGRKITMTDNTKLPLTSADLTDLLLTQLRDAAPQVISEDRVDFTKLQAARQQSDRGWIV
jgi:hypothetical protein